MAIPDANLKDSLVVIPLFSAPGLARLSQNLGMAWLSGHELEDVCAGEWLDWYALTPQQRWTESQKLWATYLALGGSLDPEPDTQSPFYDARAPRPRPAHGRTGVRVLRRGRV